MIAGWTSWFSPHVRSVQVNEGTDPEDSEADEPEPQPRPPAKRRSLRARNKPDGYVPVEEVACCDTNEDESGERCDADNSKTLFLDPSATGPLPRGLA